MTWDPPKRSIAGHLEPILRACLKLNDELDTKGLTAPPDSAILPQTRSHSANGKAVESFQNGKFPPRGFKCRVLAQLTVAERFPRAMSGPSLASAKCCVPERPLDPQLNKIYIEVLIELRGPKSCSIAAGYQFKLVESVQQHPCD